ncbi:MAG: hypothetical protein PV362_01870, partial [Providencia heimbachae]|nr:hypothetical protein [Providencia heimbachae]
MSNEQVERHSDLICEKLFCETTSRQPSGRFTVALPFIQPTPTLGCSHTLALKRFLNLENKLYRFPHLHHEYKKVLQDYLDQKHMSFVGLLPTHNLNSSLNLSGPTTISDGYYIPHFGVTKDSTSTPLRVVFDASAKTSNSLSLNDILHSGPKLQTDIRAVLLNFRAYPIALMADIKQMYRNISIRPEDRKFQRILWRFSKEEPISVFQLNTVTFGLTSSPFQALRVVQQLANDERIRYPVASKIVSSDIYVDDVATSIEDPAASIEAYTQLTSMFSSGGFELTKWATNCKILIDHIP